MQILSIDIETYSSNDLLSGGVYKYAEAPDFTILLFAYAVDHGPVRCIDLAQGERLPGEVLQALRDEKVIKTAYNALFERVCISRYFGWPLLPPEQWRCTLVSAARHGLPLTLKQCAEALGLQEGKMAEGAALIKYFSVPGKGGVRHHPQDAPEKWETFKAYNIRDVEVEQQILKRLGYLNADNFDERLYVADQHINDRGVLLDRRLAENAQRFARMYSERLAQEAHELTGMQNPNSPTQIKTWLRVHTGLPVETINKQTLDELEGSLKRYPKAQRLLSLRRQMGKTSVKKYDAMLDCVCADGRMHGLLQFYGAARTGRWAGRLVQVQNLPQNHLPDLDYARKLVKSGDLEDFLLNYDNPMGVLSELVRTAFIAKEGHSLYVCDFSAIEARVIAWLAGEQWVLDVFRKGGDIYCATASQMFHVPVEKHGRNAELRQKGKIAVLALGYGGGVAALEAMGGARMGLSREDETEIVERWRAANPMITSLWNNIEMAVKRALNRHTTEITNRGISVALFKDYMQITLPSGRVMRYPGACVDFTGNILYDGLNQTTKKWETLRTYGGKLTENVVQAIARDILGEVILRAEAKGLNIVFHVHDEIVVEAPDGTPLSEIEALFSEPVQWCPYLPLKGAGYITKYYLKD